MLFKLSLNCHCTGAMSYEVLYEIITFTKLSYYSRQCHIALLQYWKKIQYQFQFTDFQYLITEAEEDSVY